MPFPINKILLKKKRLSFVYFGAFRGKGMTEVSRIGSALWKNLRTLFLKALFMQAIVIDFNGLNFHGFLVPVSSS